MRLRSAVASLAIAAICGTVVVSGASVASAATKPRVWTVEYRVGDERIFVTYQFPAELPRQKSVPLVLSQTSEQGLAQRDLVKDLRVYRKVTGDEISVLVLVPCTPRMHHPCRKHPRALLWPIFRLHVKHPCLETGFGGAARSVAKHIPS